MGLVSQGALGLRGGDEPAGGGAAFWDFTRSVKKMLSYSEPPGYRRQAPVKRPKLDGFTAIIDAWLAADRSVPRKKRHTAKRVFDRLRAEHGFPGGYARRIVGWRVSTSAHAGFVLDALEQAVHERRPAKGMGLVHHSDRGSQYLSIRYTERLAEAGIEPSVGSVGDSYDNALAETINGLFKSEVIHRRGPWRSFEAVEYATLEWVDWFNNRRLLEPIGNIPPAEAEANFYAALDVEPMAA